MLNLSQNRGTRSGHVKASLQNERIVVAIHCLFFVLNMYILLPIARSALAVMGKQVDLFLCSKLRMQRAFIISKVHHIPVQFCFYFYF